MNTNNIAFLDIEGYKDSSEHTFGILCNQGTYKSTSASFIKNILNESSPQYICGHNFLEHDYKIVQKYSLQQEIPKSKIIDTLFLSMLLYPGKKSHKLSKPYKSEINIENQPAADSEQTKELLLLLEERYKNLPSNLKSGLYTLLKNQLEFKSFFEILNDHPDEDSTVVDLLKQKSHLDSVELKILIEENPIESAIICSQLYGGKEQNLSQIVLLRYPRLPKLKEYILFDVSTATTLINEYSQKEFGFSTFREFPSVDQGLFTVSQQSIMESAVKGKSFLCVLPTGGGKTFTFQLPAIIKADFCKKLTVIISPLQALMKNHTDNFNRQIKNFKSAALSGFLDPISRLNTLEEIKNGTIDILYLAPEALRSNVVFRALQCRVIERFVIDEAHCFSAWGHDFRHDYYYIGQCIKELQESEFQTPIAVSCFTATARPNVLDDIIRYFEKFINIRLERFIASAERTNLKYSAETVVDENQKYNRLVQLVTKFHDKPMIIYRPQNAKGCKELASQLQIDNRLSSFNLTIEPFYSKIDDDESYISPDGRTKNQILDDFISNDVNIVVATTAFGMGIDKPDIQAVIHFDPSDSLEAYMQESGRGARSSDIEAECIVLYSEKDFNRIFQNQNRSKIQYEEIDRLARYFKKNQKEKFQSSTRSIAGDIGIDTENTTMDYDSLIKTAILEMEKWEIIKRGRNHTRIYATSIISDPEKPERPPMELIHERLDPKKEEYGNRYPLMILLMQNVIQKSKNDAVEIEELAEIIGISKKDIYQIILDLQKESLLEYHNDISILIDQKLSERLNEHFDLEEKIFNSIKENIQIHKLDIRIFNEEKKAGRNSNNKVSKIINSWKAIGHLIQSQFKLRINNNICSFYLTPESIKTLETWILTRKIICKIISDFCLTKVIKEEEEIEFSSNFLYKIINEHDHVSLDFYHHSLAYLNESLDDFDIHKGRLIYYQGINLIKDEQIERNTPYHKKEYNESLKVHYNLKIEAVHILEEFFKNLEHKGWNSQKEFIKDYFSLKYKEFKRKYKLNLPYMQLPITESGYLKIIDNLNKEQQSIIDDKDSQAILVLAGPGSGKTKTLVHKIASLITIEKNKPEYFLMLTHSRVAAKEFRTRLKNLLGSTAGTVDIYTFHAYASKIVGKIIEDEQDLATLIPKAIELIQNKSYTPRFKTMLVLDEFQDIGQIMYDFIRVIYNTMSKDKRIIAVGDDDQCINNFISNSADPALMYRFLKDYESTNDEEKQIYPVKTYSLLRNYRSAENLIEFSNSFAKKLPNRQKTQDLIPNQEIHGLLELVQYHKDNFNNKSYLVHMANLVAKDESKEIAVLLRTNEEVLTIYSLLKLKGCSVQYITDNQGFDFGQIIELQDFLMEWKDCKKYRLARNFLETQYAQSLNLPLALMVIDDFIKDYSLEELEEAPVIHSNAFEELLHLVKKDEYRIATSQITVSTMHKSKGREFETVYAGIDCSKDAFSKRLFYVAITRAKKNLNIHATSGLFSNFEDYFTSIKTIDSALNIPKKISFSMNLGDLWLSNPDVQDNIEKIKPLAGETIQIKEIHYEDTSRFSLFKENLNIGKLSKPSKKSHDLNTSAKILEYEKHGFKIEPNCEIENIVYWNDPEDKNIRFKQILCRIVMTHEC